MHSEEKLFVRVPTDSPRRYLYIQTPPLLANPLVIDNPPLDARRISDTKSQAGIVVSHPKLSGEKPQRIAILYLVKPQAKTAKLSVLRPGVERPPQLHASASTSTAQLVCPRCGTPSLNLKLLNRHYCFKCKTYVEA